MERGQRQLAQPGQVAGNTRKDLGQRKAIGVGKELIVLVFFDILALDELKGHIVSQAASRPTDL